MKYSNIVKAKFISRENRFIALCDIDGKIQKVHLKNTGRLGELLIKGTTVLLEYVNVPNRKTKYDLINIYKKDKLVCIDSMASNKIFKEAVQNKIISLDKSDITLLKSEVTYKDSRFDFYFETKLNKGFVEVKSVTLEENGVAMFPDAPTLRGIKHLNGLVDAVNEGYLAYFIFIIQMNGISYFTENPVDKDFIKALRKANNAGVEVLAYECEVMEDEIYVKNEIPIKI